MKKPLILLTIAGHSNNGHGLFRGSAYPDMHTYDVISAVDGENAEVTRKRTSEEIDRTKNFLETLVDETFLGGNSLRHYDGKIYVEGTDNHDPLFDLLQLRRDNFHIDDAINFLKGACLVGHMDSAKWRKRTMERFSHLDFENQPMDMGYGTCYPGDIKKLRENGRSIEELATNPVSSKLLKELLNEGSIRKIDEYKTHDSEGYNPNLFDVYLKGNSGHGICDDAALIWLGRNYGVSAYFGGMIVDVIDTFSKISAFPMSHGADEYIGKTINKRVEKLTGKPLVSDDEITSLIYFAAKGNTPMIQFSDSVRRFHQLMRIRPPEVEGLEETARETGHHSTPTWAHLKFIKSGIMTPGLKYGFEGRDSLEFYSTLQERFIAAEKAGLYTPKPGIMDSFIPEFMPSSEIVQKQNPRQHGLHYRNQSSARNIH